MNNWKETTLSDFMEINPITKLKDDFEYSFIEMADLEASNKFTRPRRKRKPKGLTKFQNGDTLFAKITPCLENGKICQVVGLENGVGCGSTEFIILRGKDSVSDSSFVYYLSKYSALRNYAIKNMGGTAGQQRVPTTIFESLSLPLPPLPEQKQIASVLSILDDKIELLRSENETLEKIAQGIFKEWFVNFTIDGKKLKIKNGVPEGWRVGKIREIAEIKNGYAFKSEDYIVSGVPIIRTTNFNANSVILDDVVYLSEEKAKEYEKFYLEKFDFLLVMVGASIGKVVMVPSSALPALQNQNMWNFKPSQELFRFYNILLLRRVIDSQVKSASGSAREFFRKDYFYSLNVLIPNSGVLENFDAAIRPIFNKVDLNIIQIQTLSRLRDTLLPKLMSGEVKVNV